MKKQATAWVYQLKVTLKEATPAIWRRLVVPAEYSFWDLHVAIQDAMGWNDTHLHQFEIDRKHARHPLLFGIPFKDDDMQEPHLRPKPDWEYTLDNFVSPDMPEFEYLYDFGDHWNHQIELEGIYHAEPGVSYPQCIGGERAGPPDDCGGVPGYEQLLEVIQDPKHPDHADSVRWLKSIKGKFDPGRFTPSKVRFSDPAQRWSQAFGVGKRKRKR